MTELRAEKIDKIAEALTDPEMNGPEKGDVLVISWGSTYGTVRTAVEEMQRLAGHRTHVAPTDRCCEVRNVEGGEFRRR